MGGLSLSLGLGLGSYRISNGGSASPFALAQANGWLVDYAATPPSDNPMASFDIVRQGFTATGTTTSYTEPMIVTQRTRLPYPDQSSLTNTTCAVSDYILSTDIIVGATNNSTQIAPTPIAAWAMPARQLVGNSLTLEVTGNHWSARDGKPFACVVFTVTDGTTTFTATANAMVVSGKATDNAAVLVYRAVIDITSLATGLITANAKVYPWIGAIESVADSSTGTTSKGFSPRKFYKDVARLASPPLAYVASTGVDATGVVSTNAATASASPYLTVQGALVGLVAATGVTGGYVDGCRIRIKDTVAHGASTAAAKSQRCAAVVIERDPNVARSAAVISVGVVWRPNIGGAALLGGLTEGALMYSDVTVRRTASANIWSYATSTYYDQMIVLSDMDFDLGGYAASIVSGSTGGRRIAMSYDGATISNATGSSALAGGANVETRLFRGVSVDRNTASLAAHTILGCQITNPTLVANEATSTLKDWNGFVCQFNRFLKVTSEMMNIESGTTVTTQTNISFSQNLMEVIHADTTAKGGRMSGDGANLSLVHALFDNNTIAASNWAVGRINNWYDETIGVYRSFAFCRMRNAIAGGVFTKRDVFVGENGNGTPNPTDAPFHVNSWAPYYGVGHRNLHTLFVEAGNNSIGGSQGFAYAGIGSSIATSQTVPQYATSAWTDWKATTSSGTTPVAGAGGGDYTLPTGSALLGKVATGDEVFPYDLAGAVRDRGGLGAYR